MKRFVAFILATVFVLTTITVVNADIVFSDIKDDFWAKDTIYMMVDEGIINGYTDGTFRPDNYVNRAEFAKLVGPDDTPNTQDFVDVDPAFWGYSYIMASGIDAGEANFNPHNNMLRGEVCEVLYDRHGNNAKVKVPSMITEGEFDVDAISWAYSTGLMIGNDGIHLRLNDPLTRAEVVTLIVRARNLEEPSKTLSDNADEKVLAYLVNGLDIFDFEYDDDRVLTNAEIALAAARLGYSRDIPGDISTLIPKFKNEYSSALALMCEKVWGKENCTEKFAEKDANMQDMVSAFTLAYMIRTKADELDYNMKGIYSDYKDNSSAMGRFIVSAAYNSGIMVEGDKLNAKDKVTMRDLGAILLQFNNLSGLDYLYRGKMKDAEINVDITECSKEVLENYALLLKDVPVEIYKKDLAFTTSPKEMTRFMRSFGSVFEAVLDTVKENANKAGYNVEFTYYPTIATKSEQGYILRLKAVSYTDAVLKDFINVNNENYKFETGKVYFIDVETHCGFAELLSEISKLEVVNVIKAY